MITVNQLAGHRLVFAYGSAWSDEELLLLLAYAEQGGTVFVLDDQFGRLDESHEQAIRPYIEELIHQGHLQHGDGELFFRDVDPGYDYYLTHNPVSLAWVEDYIPGDVTRIEAPEGVLVTPYLHDGSLVLHILDYQFNGAFDIREDLRITLRTPGLTEHIASQATCYCPITLDSSQIEVVSSGQELALILPKLNIWSVVETNVTTSQ